MKHIYRMLTGVFVIIGVVIGRFGVEFVSQYELTHPEYLYVPAGLAFFAGFIYLLGWLVMSFFSEDAYSEWV